MGQRIQAALVAVDRRAAAAVEAELAETTVAELVGSTHAATLADAGGAPRCALSAQDQVAVAELVPEIAVAQRRGIGALQQVVAGDRLEHQQV